MDASNDQAQLALLATVLGLALLVGVLGARSFPAILLVLLGSALIFQESAYLLAVLVLGLPPFLYSWILWNTARAVFPKEKAREVRDLAEALRGELGLGWRVEPIRVFWEESSPLRIRVWETAWKLTDGEVEIVVVPHEVELKEGGKYWLPSLPRFLLRHVHERGLLWMPFATFREEGIYPLHGGYLVVGKLPVGAVKAQVLAMRAAWPENGLAERLARRLSERNLRAEPIPGPVYMGDQPSKAALWAEGVLVLVFGDSAFVPASAQETLPVRVLVVKWGEKGREERLRPLHVGKGLTLVQVEGGEEFLGDAIGKRVLEGLK